MYFAMVFANPRHLFVKGRNANSILLIKGGGSGPLGEKPLNPRLGRNRSFGFFFFFIWWGGGLNITLWKESGKRGGQKEGGQTKVKTS